MIVEKGQVWRTGRNSGMAERYTYVVVAVHKLDNTTYVWHTSGREDDYMISASENSFLCYAEPMPDFFEEGKTYKHNLTGNRYTVWHVHEMAKTKIAVAQHTNGTPAFFLQDDWNCNRYKEV